MERRFITHQAAVVLAVMGTVLAACGGDGESELSSVSLGIEYIDAAVDAVRDQQQSEPRFFEINSTADGVSLFLAVTRAGDDGAPDAVIQGRYTPEGGLVLADELLEASGSVFSMADLELSPDRLAENVIAELSTSTPLMFVLTAANGDESDAPPTMRIIMESARGGRLAVFIDRNGVILGTEVVEG